MDAAKSVVAQFAPAAVRTTNRIPLATGSTMSGAGSMRAPRKTSRSSPGGVPSPAMRNTGRDIAVTVLVWEQRWVATSQRSAVQASSSAHAVSLAQSSTSVTRASMQPRVSSSSSPSPHPPSLRNVAVLVTLPIACGTTTMVTVACTLASSAPMLQTTGALPVHVPWLAVADTTVAPAGGTSVSTTPVSALSERSAIV